MAIEHMEAIAVAAQEQSSGLVQVNAAINHMDQATQHNAAMVEEMNAAGAGLAGECVVLDEQLSRFTVENQGSYHRIAPSGSATPSDMQKPVA